MSEYYQPLKNISLRTQSDRRPHAGKKFYIETLGCQMNVADSELIVSMLNVEKV